MRNPSVSFVTLAAFFLSFATFPLNGQSTHSAVPASCTTTIISVNSSDTGNVTPAGINDSDTVVGSFSDLVTFQNHGFTWSNGTGTLYDFPGASQTGLGGINNSGLAVGSYANSQGQWVSFFLSSTGQTSTFSVPGAYDTVAHGINNHNVVVGSWDAFGSGTTTGFVKHGNTYQNLQYPGALNTAASAINDAGVVVGTYYDGSAYHGFAEYNGKYVTIEPAGASYAIGLGINRSGEIVGGYRPNPYAEGEGFTYLNGKTASYMYPQSTYTELTAVNSLGDRVGDAITANSEFLTGPGFILSCH